MVLNHSRRLICMWTAGLVALMTLFPPFHVKLPNGAVVASGYGFLLWPPKLDSSYTVIATVNATQLGLQWAGCLLVAGILFAVAAGDTAPRAGAAAKARPWMPLVEVLTRVARALTMILGWLLLVSSVVASWQYLSSAETTEVPDQGKALVLFLAPWVGAAVCFLVGAVLGRVVHTLHVRVHGVKHPDMPRWYSL
jgi:hypothetical protein